jgi:hypothetical protein
VPPTPVVSIPSSIPGAQIQAPLPELSVPQSDTSDILVRRSDRISRPVDRLNLTASTLCTQSAIPALTPDPSLAYFQRCSRLVYTAGTADPLTRFPPGLIPSHLGHCYALTLDAALKTKYREDVEKAAVKECKNLVDFKVWRYLKRKEDASPSVHKNILPCSLIVKDKRDSHGNLLAWKGRLANGGHRTDPAFYDPNERTSPTAHIDSIYTFLAFMEKEQLSMELFDVPSAYLNARLKDGHKHLMRIRPTIATFVCKADPPAKEFLQSDGSLLVELDKALYGLPEAGTLWHELFTGILARSGYTSCPGDSCLWSRFDSDGSISLLLLYVDDVMHLYKGKSIRDRLYKKLKDAGLPKLTMSYLEQGKPVSFLGLSIEKTARGHLFISQPGYTASIVAAHGTGHKSPSPLPSNFTTRNLKDEDLKELSDKGKHQYLQLCMRISWLTRTRPDLSAAVSYKQVYCNRPRNIDWKDLQHMVNYLEGTLNLGIKLHVTELQPKLSIDAALAVHEDRKSHGGAMVTAGDNGPPLAWKSGKHDRVTAGTTESELYSLATYLGLILYVRDLLTFLKVKVNLPITLYQDNTSTITIAYMGRPSVHARRKFIDTKYFWFKQYLDDGIIKLAYCPSKEMIADCLASIRSGGDFLRFRRITMGN